MQYNNEKKTIRAKSDKSGSLAILFEEGYDANATKHDWIPISASVRDKLKQYFDDLSSGDKVEIGKNDKGSIIFLKKTNGTTTNSGTSVPSYTRSSPKTNGVSLIELAKLAQFHAIKIVNLDDATDSDAYWKAFRALIGRYDKEIREATNGTDK